jgi:hypothetical protein
MRQEIRSPEFFVCAIWSSGFSPNLESEAYFKNGAKVKIETKTTSLNLETANSSFRTPNTTKTHRDEATIKVVQT